MYVFKLSLTAGTNTPEYPPGTVTSALCLVEAADSAVARDRALLELNTLGWESCTFLDVMQLPAAPNPANSSPAMQRAYGDARRQGAAVIVYPPAPATP
ncbi:MAG: hypothetical protein ACJ8GK_12875 [Luteimonas sp.]